MFTDLQYGTTNSKLIFLIETFYSNGICLFILIARYQKDCSLDFFSFLLCKGVEIQVINWSR